jgi:pyruvate-ferredoxin/flavodoxin oxidoreductase
MRLRFFVIDAVKGAHEAGMGGRINTVMQTCFFAINGVLPREEAIAAIKRSIEKSYGKRGEAVVRKNFAAVDSALDHLYEVKVPSTISSEFDVAPPVPAAAARIIAGEGDALPVSALPPDGTFATGTAQWEKRNIAFEIPVWDEELCIQCGKCVLVCPHSVIRAKIYDATQLQGAPDCFKSTAARWKDFKTMRYTLQVAPRTARVARCAWTCARRAARAK